MIDPIITKNEPITLVGGANLKPALLHLALEFASHAVGADSGADALCKLGKDPLAVIGDMDSIDVSVTAQIPKQRIHRIHDQDSTDFEKCLMRLEAPLLICVGFLGGQVHHQMAAQTALVRNAHKRCILLGEEDIVFVVPPKLSLDLEAGVRVSLYPMAKCRIHSHGLHWPTTAIDFSPDGKVGTSNKSTGPIRLMPDCPKMLAILPLECLSVVLEALMKEPQWSVGQVLDSNRVNSLAR